MNTSMDKITLKFRRTLSKARMQSILFTMVLGILLVTGLNILSQSISLLNHELVYFLALIAILIICLSFSIYFLENKKAQALKLLDPILLDDCDAKAYCDYLEHMIHRKKKQISPSLLEAYLSGLAYINDKEKAHQIYYQYQSFLPNTLGSKFIRFNQLPFAQQKKEFANFYDEINGQLKKQLELRNPSLYKLKVTQLHIRKALLNFDYASALTLLKSIDMDNVPHLIDAVTLHYQFALCYTKLKQKQHAQPHIDFVLEHGNTTFYVDEVTFLKSA